MNQVTDGTLELPSRCYGPAASLWRARLWATPVTSVLVGRSSELEELHVRRCQHSWCPELWGNDGDVAASTMRQDRNVVAHRGARVVWHTAAHGWPWRHRRGRIVSPSAPTRPRRARADLREVRTAAFDPLRSRSPSATGTVEAAGSCTEHPRRSSWRNSNGASDRIEGRCLRHSTWSRSPAVRSLRFTARLFTTAFMSQ